ncbi:hypothetical protein [Maricaulis maris]|uniref:Uncharacterized protein n=1 Tax=Maricaulis maris TaxID=74318 RepID=A0A495D1P7_9PROT|nr:hypothetical protein [Maricaulis maris]RKQ95458.1 hypothetical protein C7435_2560 [Maricaulis maris]
METERPNPDDFQRDEQTGLFYATVRFSGSARIRIQADDAEDARQQAENITAAPDPSGWLGPDDVDEAEVDRITPAPTMYLITRNGKPMKATWLEPGDLPREPDERGF